MRKIKFVVLTVACFAIVVSTYVSKNANKSSVGDITLVELINTPDANACMEATDWDPRPKGTCALSNNCYNTMAYNVPCILYN